MKNPTQILIGCIVLTLCALAVHAGAPSGRWEGKIDVPGNPLDITVDLKPTDEGGWVGEIDIPAQGLADFPLGEIKVEGSAVSFAMSGIPGEPLFRGTLTEDGSVLAGEFAQGGSAIPFRLARTGDTEIEAPPPAPPISAELAAALAGRWEGKLEVPGQPLRIAFVLELDSEGTLSATLDSPDQGQTGLPVSRLTVDGGTVRAELSFARAVYEGTLNEARTEISGEWQQGGGSMPLTLRKQGASTPQAFPQADPESVGIPARALELLAERVQTLVDSEAIVGGELIVIKNRRTVFREAFGWKDREAEQPLEVDSLYCVRSMTKPLVGTAIQMLIDEDRLRLDTPVQEILPFFAGPETGKITIEHLLTHTAGFPFTTIGKPLTEYADLAAVAAEAAGTELGFEPGTRFEYSDAGSDTLGAIVAKITGAPVEQFIQQRILDPLGMQDTVVLLGDDDEVKARIPSAYSGGTGLWSEHWGPSDPPIFPIFLASQSLYSTTTDYARFLALWMDGGQVGDRRLLSPEAVERALTPNRPIPDYPQSFGGLEVYYGQQWMVYAKPATDGSPHRVLFGHDGSDGTHAWAWPELDLMVLFFTQSRGTLAGLSLEGALQTLLVEQALDDPSLTIRVPDQDELAQVAGLYWDETNISAYYVVTPRGDGLTVERPGRMHLVFKAGETPGRFVHEANSQIWIEFERSKDGKFNTMRNFFGGQIENAPRHVPQEGLPSVEEVIALVQQAHHLDRLPELGAVRLSGTLKLETRGMEGPITTLFDATRERTEVQAGAVQEIFVKDDGRVWTYSTAAGLDELDGIRLEQALLDRFAVLFGDWTRYYEHVEVLKRLQFGDDNVLLVRVVPREAPGATMFIHEASGMLRIMDSLVMLPGLGIVGVQTRYEDFRDVGGMQLPFITAGKFASQLIGRVVTTLDKAEVGVAVSKDTFAAPTMPDE